MIGQILEWVLLAIILISALIGSNRGFLLSVFAMVKNLLTIIAAAASAPTVVSRLSKSWPVREAIGYGIALVVWMLVFGIIARLIRIAESSAWFCVWSSVRTLGRVDNSCYSRWRAGILLGSSDRKSSKSQFRRHVAAKLQPDHDHIEDDGFSGDIMRDYTFSLRRRLRLGEHT